MSVWRLCSLTAACVNQLGAYAGNCSDEILTEALKSRKNFDSVSKVANELQNSLSFDCHIARNEEARRKLDRVKNMSDFLFEERIINNDIIRSESVQSLDSLYPQTCQQMKGVGIKKIGKVEYLAACLRTLRKIELCHRQDIDEKHFSAKTKSFIVEQILQSMNRIKPYII